MKFKKKQKKSLPFSCAFHDKSFDLRPLWLSMFSSEKVVKRSLKTDLGIIANSHNREEREKKNLGQLENIPSHWVGAPLPHNTMEKKKSRFT